MNEQEKKQAISMNATIANTIQLNGKTYTVKKDLSIDIEEAGSELKTVSVSHPNGKLVKSALEQIKKLRKNPADYYGYGWYAIPAEVGAIVEMQKKINAEEFANSDEGKAIAAKNAWVESEVKKAREYAEINDGHILGGYNPHVVNLESEGYFVSGPYSVFPETKKCRGDNTPHCKQDY
jgi:hypothetical protein